MMRDAHGASNTNGGSAEPTPFHAGERAAQRRAGVEALAEPAGRRGIRTFIPDQHRTFYAQLPFLVVGGVDGAGQPWATLRVGTPGFVSSPDPRTLTVAGGELRDDPLADTWREGSLFGALGIELPTRRRNRINGVVTAAGGDALSVEVSQSFGNCAKYIQSRTPVFVPRDDAGLADGRPTLRHADQLDADDLALVARADTFFIASANTLADARGARGVDVSHRGGPPGFVRADDARTLTTPDYAGNHFFNTIGNLLHDPRAGLLFVDFERGDLLYVAADAQIVWDGPEVDAFGGAQRLVRFRVRDVRRSRAVLPFRWSAAQPAPQFRQAGEASAQAAVVAVVSNSASGGEGARRCEGVTQPEAAGAVSADAATDHAVSPPASAAQPVTGWRMLRVSAVRDETPSVRSFYFAAADGRPLAPFEPGQHLTIRVPAGDGGAPLVRSYTLSARHDGRRYRISVKRDGRVSSWLHDHLREGARIEALAPRGAFTFDAASPRPAVLVSAGIGITPMIAMLERALDGALGAHVPRRVFFVHGARDALDRPFVGALAALARRHPQLSVHLFDSRRSSDVGDADAADRVAEARGEAILDTTPGRVDIDALKRVLPFDDYDFYLCGPSSFMKALYDGLRALNVPDERIRFEAFGPSSVTRSARRSATRDADAATHAQSGEGARAATVVFARSGRSATWTPKDGSLLAFVEAQRVPVDSDCRSGACGTCAARLLSGRVAYSAPVDAQVEPGCALLCVATPDLSGAAGDATITLDV